VLTPCVALYFPAAQSVQTEAPAPEYLPATQSVQTSLVCSGKPKNLPASQSVQEVSPEVASESGRQLRVLHDTLPRSEPDGGHIAPALGAVSPRGARWAAPTRRCRPGGVPSPWPAGSCRRDAGAAGREPVSSGGLLANFLLLQVGVCVRAGADRCRVCCCAGWVFAMSQVRACLHLMRVVLPGPILHAN
jgi:hypothetical protein